MRNLIPALLFALLTACQTAQVAQLPKPVETPAAAIPCNADWQPAYSDFIANHLPAELLGISPTRMKSICPNYGKVDHTAAWVNIIKAVAYAESGYNRCSRFQEDMGNDSETGAPVTSEGLVQLSYDDVDNYPRAKGCGISWALDKSKGATDPSKTIFDAEINLRCGMMIMASDVSTYASKDFQDAVSEYWETLKKNDGHDCDAKGKLAKIYPACGTRACE